MDHAKGTDKEELIVSSNGLMNDDPVFLKTKALKRRYYILFVFCFATWLTCEQWNVFGPISASALKVFPDWSSTTIAMLENTVTIMYIICIIPLSWFIDVYGLRRGIILTTGLLTLGLSLRCVGSSTPMFTIMSYISSVCTGLSITLVLAAPTMVTVKWFPQHERTTVTSIIMCSAMLGNVGSYMEPLIVREPESNVSVDEITKDIMMLMYISAIIGLVLFFLCCIYFPNNPPIPPSLSSQTERLDLKGGLRFLSSNLNLWLYVVGYGFAIGPVIGFTGVLDFSLLNLGFDQVATISAIITTIIVGVLTDKLYGHLKETIIVMLLGAAAFYYWFLLLVEGVITCSKWQVYVALTFGWSLSHATIPLFFELGSEMAYPVSEFLVAGSLTASDSLFTGLFLSVYNFKSLGFNWVPYVLTGCTAFCVVLILFVKSDYNRSVVDKTTNSSTTSTPPLDDEEEALLV